VLDNCSVHHVGVVDSTLEMRTIVHFLPPYSPDLTPIELLFSKVKVLIRAIEMEMNTLSDLDTIVLAFSCITSDDCRSWISSITESVDSLCRDSADTQYMLKQISKTANL